MFARSCDWNCELECATPAFFSMSELTIANFYPNIGRTVVRETLLFSCHHSKLVKLGLLVARDAGQWWAGIPGSSVFTHALARGRAALLLTLRRAKRHELPRAEVESSKMPRGAKLGVSYYVYDALGASLVVCARTTAGDVLRLRE